jgi:NitT/TauT family transport system substrate-binding protein
MKRFRFIAVLALAATVLAPWRAGAEDIKVGIIKSIAGGPIYLARDNGYFAAEGLTVEIIFFDAAQPIAVATTSRDIEIGVTGLTGGLYALAAQGELRLVAGQSREVPGFNFNAYVVSKRAWDAGLRSYKDFPGHSFAISQTGSPPHYALALLAEKYGFDLKSMRILPLQSISNIASAVVGGQADTASLLGTPAIPIIERGDVKLLGWTGDETPWQLGACFVSTKVAIERADMVTRFLRAYRKGAHDYHDAFAASDGRRVDGPSADAVAAVISKYTGLTAPQVKSGVVYVDAEARLDVKDVAHQIDWYRSQGLLKSAVPMDSFIDRRFVVPLDGG